MFNKIWVAAFKSWSSILKGLLIAMGGAGLVYLAANLTNMDFGDWSPALVALGSALINVLKKVLEEYGKEDEEDDTATIIG